MGNLLPINRFKFLIFALPSPSAPLRLNESIGRFRRALFEFRGGARCVCPARASCAAPDGFIQPKEAIGWRGRGRLLLVTFLGEARKVTGGGATPRDFASSPQPSPTRGEGVWLMIRCYFEAASNFAIKLSNSFGNGATSRMGSPVSGCANAML